MNATPQQSGPSNVGTPEATVPIGLRILAIILRALFIGALVAVTVRVSSPQSETLRSVYETPDDLIRVALGFAVCLWIVIHLFILPRTAEPCARPACMGSRHLHLVMHAQTRGAAEKRRGVDCAKTEIDNQHSMLMRLSFRATSFSASKISGDCENDASAS